MRPIKVTKNFINSAENSVLYESGNTKVLVTVSVSTRLPDWLLNSDKGWVTAEYNMLPGSSGNRISRKSYESGRSKEISRLIGRSLRAVCNLGIINGYSFTVDCDVLEADGGTRTASVNGAWIALNDTFEKMIQENKLNQNPLTSKVGAISVGIVAGELVADLDYEKDSNAEVDLNLVLDEKFEILEIQGTAEGKPFQKEHLDKLFDLDDETYKGLMIFSKKIAEALKKAVDCQRIGISVIGLEVPHVHVHLIPINKMDDMSFNSKIKLSDDEFVDIMEKIKSYL